MIFLLILKDIYDIKCSSSYQNITVYQRDAAQWLIRRLGWGLHLDWYIRGMWILSKYGLNFYHLFFFFILVWSLASPFSLPSSLQSHVSHQLGRVKANSFPQRHVKSVTAFLLLLLFLVVFFYNSCSFTGSHRESQHTQRKKNNSPHTWAHIIPTHVSGSGIDRGERVILSLTRRKRCQFFSRDPVSLW